MSLDRRTPLARGKGPERKTPLGRGAGLSRAPRPVRAVPRPAPGGNSGPTPEDRRLVLERDGYACVCRGQSVIGRRYSLGHRVRASQGGRPVPVNLITLLGWGGESHHGRIDLYRDAADADKGYRLPSGTDPALVPVAYATPDGYARFWLLPDGTRSSEPPLRAAA